MKMRLLKIISFGSIALLMAVLVTATIFDKLYGTRFVTENIYHSWPFIAQWAVLALSGNILTINVSRRKIIILLHISLAIILFGAFISFMTSQRGEISLPMNRIPASMFTTTDGRLEKLPFRLQLEKADTCYIGKSEDVANYRAYIIANYKKKKRESFIISLNNPAKIEDYSICLKGITKDKVSLLVSYDPWGLPISYAGYIMTFISFIALFFDKRSGLNKLLKKSRLHITYKNSLIAVFIVIITISRIATFRGNDSPPILQTSLLVFHVSAIIIAYSLIACTALNSIISLFHKSNGKRLESAAITGRLLLYPATMLLATGIFIGAVWANISWGRYWGWDPKEVWALLTLFACSMTLHTRSLPFMSRPLFFHIYSIALSIVMLFTYFGVNFLLGGIHSYM